MESLPVMRSVMLIRTGNYKNNNDNIDNAIRLLQQQDETHDEAWKKLAPSMNRLTFTNRITATNNSGKNNEISQHTTLLPPCWLQLAYNISVNDLPTLPFYDTNNNMFGRMTSYEVPANQLLSTIANHLRLRSIASTLKHDKSVETSVRCQTNEQLQFHINLYCSEEKDSSVVIMEIQRRRGCCIEMQRCRRELLFAIQSNTDSGAHAIKATVNEKTRFVTSTPPPVSASIKQRYEQQQQQQERTTLLGRKRIRKQQKRTEEMDAQLRTTNDAMLKCLELLQSGYHDQRILGMRSLLSLTRGATATTTTQTAVVLRALVHGEGPFGKSLQHEILRSLQPEQPHNMMQSYDDADFSGMEMKSTALQVLVHWLRQLEQQHQLESSSLSSSSSSELCHDVSRVLLEHLLDTDTRAMNPCDVASMLSCIEVCEQLLLLTQSHPTMIRQAGGATNMLLMSFNDYGKAHHCSLEQVSRRLIGMAQ